MQACTWACEDVPHHHKAGNHHACAAEGRHGWRGALWESAAQLLDPKSAALPLQKCSNEFSPADVRSGAPCTWAACATPAG